MAHETNNYKAHINGMIDEIKAAEKVTKKLLGIISREIMSYVLDTDDIASVNRLIGVLTPMNKKTAELFFCHFLPWEQEKNSDDVFQRFGKKLKGEKKVQKKTELIKTFLADTDNTIWTWAQDNVQIEPKKKDFSHLITMQIRKAMDGDEKSDTPPLTSEDIMKAVFAGGVSIDDMLSGIQLHEDKLKEEQALAEAVMQEGQSA